MDVGVDEDMGVDMDVDVGVDFDVDVDVDAGARYEQSNLISTLIIWVVLTSSTCGAEPLGWMSE